MSLDLVVCTAFHSDGFPVDELTPWLDRHDALDRYASVRAVSNADRPTGDGGGLHSWADGLALAVENAHRAASSAVDSLVDDWP